MKLCDLAIGTYFDNRDRRVNKLVPEFEPAVLDGLFVESSETDIFDDFFSYLTDEEAAWEIKHCDGFWPASVEHFQRVSDGAVFVLDRAGQTIEVTTGKALCEQLLAELREMIAEENQE